MSDEDESANPMKAYVGLGLTLWFVYVALANVIEIPIPLFGEWYLMSIGERFLIFTPSLLGGVYGWTILYHQIKKKKKD